MKAEFYVRNMGRYFFEIWLLKTSDGTEGFSSNYNADIEFLVQCLAALGSGTRWFQMSNLNSK